jgi:hypothetical protein
MIKYQGYKNIRREAFIYPGDSGHRKLLCCHNWRPPCRPHPSWPASLLRQGSLPENLQTTIEYIDTLDASDRRPPNARYFDVTGFLREAPPELDFPDK